jgi:hypothetical protein
MKREKIVFFKSNKVALIDTFLSDMGKKVKKGIGVSESYTFYLQQKFK